MSVSVLSRTTPRVCSKSSASEVVELILASPAAQRVSKTLRGKAPVAPAQNGQVLLGVVENQFDLWVL